MLIDIYHYDKIFFMKKVALISHGCAKNLVDSELILGILVKNGYEITLDEKIIKLSSGCIERMLKVSK